MIEFKKKPSLHTYFTGMVDLTTSGNAYIVVDDLDDDVFVPYNRLNKAFHGDTVEVFLKPKRKGKKAEGEISKVIERKKTSYVGIVDKQKTFAFIRPSDPRMYTDIFIPMEKLNRRSRFTLLRGYTNSRKTWGT